METAQAKPNTDLSETTILHLQNAMSLMNQKEFNKMEKLVQTIKLQYIHHMFKKYL